MERCWYFINLSIHNSFDWGVANRTIVGFFRVENPMHLVIRELCHYKIQFATHSQNCFTSVTPNKDYVSLAAAVAVASFIELIGTKFLNLSRE